MSLVEKALKRLQENARPLGALNTASDSQLAAQATQPIEQPIAAAAKPAPHVKRIDINRAALRAGGLLPPEHQERQIADQYRQIKRPLIANATGRGVPKIALGHLIMTASALPGEGKTFTSINLALSLAAEKDISVLLVDADIPKPHVSRVLGLASEPGLLDVLADESIDVESLVFDTDIPGLSILPAGRRAETATEMLASSRMEETVATLSAYNPNRIILLDSPPLLLTSESRALAMIVGQVVVVVRAGFTPQQTVLDALSYLGENKAIGLVLNQCDTNVATAYYGQYAYGDNSAKTRTAG